jgi:hypothetical protein
VRVPEDDTDVLVEVSSLIDAWCERRELRALSKLLPAWLANTGMTDGWALVLEALKSVRADGSLPDEELRSIDRSIVAVERAVYRT